MCRHLCMGNVKCFHFSQEKKTDTNSMNLWTVWGVCLNGIVFLFQNSTFKIYIRRERERLREWWRRMNGTCISSNTTMTWYLFYVTENFVQHIHSHTHANISIFHIFFGARSRFYKHIARQQATKSCVFKIPCPLWALNHRFSPSADGCVYVCCFFRSPVSFMVNKTRNVSHF